MTVAAGQAPAWWSSVLTSVVPVDPESVPIRLGLYARISSADDDMGVSRQVREMREKLPSNYMLRGRELIIVDVYIDNDVSAYKVGTVRDEWQRMLSDLESGRINSVGAFALDRLARQPHDGETLLTTMYASKAQVIVTTFNDNVNIVTDEGIDMFRLRVIMANGEVRNTIRRINSKSGELAKNGAFSGGKRRYGWNKSMTEIDNIEAAVLLEAAFRKLAGESWHAIVKDFNRRGISTALGSIWSITSLTRCVTGPHVVGLRVHNKQVMETPAQWPPILKRETWLQLQLEKGANPGQRGTGGEGKPRHALTSVMKCGRCGNNLRRARPKGKEFWQCNSPRGCHGINQADEKLSVWIIGELLAAYRDTDFIERIMAADVDTESRMALITALRATKAELNNMELAYWSPPAEDRPKPPEHIFVEAKKSYETKIERLQAQLRDVSGKQSLDPELLLSGDLDARWPSLPLAAKRALVQFLIRSVTVHQVFTTRKSIRPEDHYTINWRDEVAAAGR